MAIFLFGKGATHELKLGFGEMPTNAEERTQSVYFALSAVTFGISVFLPWFVWRKRAWIVVGLLLMAFPALAAVDTWIESRGGGGLHF